MTGTLHLLCLSHCFMETIVGNLETCITNRVLVSDTEVCGDVGIGGRGGGGSDISQCRKRTLQHI